MSGGTILVTGSASSIGSNIVSALCDVAAADVVVCDRMRYAALGRWRNLSKHHFKRARPFG